jgi:hypothetical protein
MLFQIDAGLKGEAINAYSSEGLERKKAFHKDGKKFLRQLAAQLALRPGSIEIRSNVGGIAVSGEVTLHSERLYVQLSESMGPGVQILYRYCEGLKDYTGGTNNWYSVELLKTSAGQTRFWENCVRILSACGPDSRRTVSA